MPELTPVAARPSANETLVREIYAALARGDMDAIRARFAADCVMHIPGNNPISGAKRGVDELIAYFGQLITRSEGTFAIDLQQVMSNDTYVSAFHHETGRKAGASLDNQLAVVARIDGGLAQDLWVFYFDQAQADAFWR